jgi:hypothetical protein
MAAREHRSRLVLGAIGIAAMAVLAACGAPTDTSIDSGQTSGSTTATTAAESESVDSFEVFAVRDPFEPPFTETVDTTQPTTGSTTPGETTTPTTSPSFEPPAGQTVSVLDVFENEDGSVAARVQVGSTVYTVSEGQTFATSYQVVSLDADAGCGVFLFGDTQFELCEGEQVIK